MPKRIAFFDFDGTITRSDTLLELAKFAAGSTSFYLKMIRISPWLIAMKIGVISNEKAKEKMLGVFYKGINIKKFDGICEDFVHQSLPALIRPDAMIEIARLKAMEVPVYVVTASAENWIAPWCKQNNVGFIATQLEVIDDKITGNLKGLNCNNEEKARRIKTYFDLSTFDEIYCYGDTAGDNPMLALATHPHYRVFEG